MFFNSAAVLLVIKSWIVPHLTLFICCIGQASYCRPEESQVSPAWGRPSNIACCLQLVAQQQVLKCVVLWELCASPNAEESAGRSQADAWHHGPVGLLLCVCGGGAANSVWHLYCFVTRLNYLKPCS